MPDLLEVLFDQMRDQRPLVPFAPPELIRRRGRQRAHLQALGVGAAVLAVAGVGVGLPWLVDLDPAPDTGGVSPPVSAAATPGPTASAEEWTDVSPADMLQPSDLGVGTWTPLSPEGVFKGADRWYWADLHEGYRPGDYPSRARQVGQRVVRYEEGGRQATVEEIVERYEVGWAARNVADIQAVVARNGAIPYARPGAGAPLRHEIVDTDLAGDESLLIEQKPWSFNGSTTIPQSDRQLIAVVRVGDLVATVIPQIGAEPEVAQVLAAAAAARLR